MTTIHPLQLVIEHTDSDGQPQRWRVADVDTSPQGTINTVRFLLGLVGTIPISQVYPPTDFRTSVGMVHARIQRDQRFEPDPVGVELVRIPCGKAGPFAGDCDDAALLAAMALRHRGHVPVLCVIGTKGTRGEHTRYRHILPGVRTGWKHGLSMTRGDVYLFDPQENRPPGHWPEDYGADAIYAMSLDGGVLSV